MSSEFLWILPLPRGQGQNGASVGTAKGRRTQGAPAKRLLHEARICPARPRAASSPGTKYTHAKTLRRREQQVITTFSHPAPLRLRVRASSLSGGGEVILARKCAQENKILRNSSAKASPVGGAIGCAKATVAAVESRRRRLLEARHIRQNHFSRSPRISRFWFFGFHRPRPEPFTLHPYATADER